MASTEKEGKAKDWSGLPLELLRMIAAKVVEIVDYGRFRSVCVNWRSAAPAADLTAPQLPLLFPPYLPTKECNSFRFFTLPSASPHSLHLPDLGSISIFGSSRGRLLALRKSQSKSPLYASLLNPLTHAQIPLPPFPSRAAPDESWSVNLRRLIWPSASEWLVLVQFTDTFDLFFCRTGDAAWNKLPLPPHWSHCLEVIYYRGRFFVISSNSVDSTLVIDAASLAKVHEVPRVQSSSHCRNYLVESSAGELLLVCKTYELEGWKHTNHELKVYQLEYDGDQPRWLRVRNLGDEVLFVDFCNALSLSSRGFHGLRRNCIYFVEGKVVSVFNLQDGREEQLLCLEENPQRKWATTYAWMIPSLQ